MNKAWSAAGRSYCCPRHCMSKLHLCQEGLALPNFQRRLRRFPHMSREWFASKLTNKNGWWYTKDERLVIPNLDVVKKAIVHVSHAPMCMGHVGFLKTQREFARRQCKI
eukprot:946151-Pelagomonas_calceolata.AAC.1